MDRSVILVTGAGGFIGRRLCETLQNSGRCVRAVLLPGEPPPIAEECVTADIRYTKDLEKLAGGNVACIYHLAAHASVPGSVENPRKDFMTNTIGTFNMLELARQLRPDCFLFASTVSTLDLANPLPLNETARYGPGSPYGAAKMSGEGYCTAYARTYNLPTKIVRMFNVYGPGRKGMVVYDLISKLLNDSTKLPILGDGSQIRDFLFIDDAVLGLKLIAEKATPQQIYHLGSGQPTTIRRLAQLIIKHAGLGDVPVVPSGDTWKGDWLKWYADVTKVRKLGFEPLINLDEGVKRTMKWVQSIRKK